MTPTDAVATLGETFSGQVIAPGNISYDRIRRPFYRFYDKRPAAIVQPATIQDVSRVVALSADAGAELAVRGGGHSLAGHSTTDGGILLDLSQMNEIEIDPSRQVAWAEAGATAGHYTAATAVHGLATGFGDTGSVGIGGLTLGGGVGFLVRKQGLTIDNLLGAEMVLADGSIVEVNEDQHPDLFWAIRGGGGNFGVVTRFQYRLHQVGMIVGGLLVLPATAEVIFKVIAEAGAAPEELTVIANVMNAPPMPGLDDQYLGRPVVMLLIVHAGPVGAGERAVAPFRTLTSPLLDVVGPMAYPNMFQFTADEIEIKHEIARSQFSDTVDIAGAEAIVEYLHRSAAPIAVAQLRVLGGAAARISNDATAFAHRHRKVMIAVGTVYDEVQETDMHRQWVDGLAEALVRGERGVYVGFLGDEGERVHDAYPDPTWDRLAEIKARYDPANLFRLNQNVPPGP